MMLNFETVTCQTTLRYVDVVSSSEYFIQIVLNLPRICLIKQERRNKCLVIFNKEVIGTLNFFKHEVFEEDALLRAHVFERNRMIQEK